MNENQKPTWNDIKEMFAESAKLSKETYQLNKESAQLIKENAQQLKETKQVLREKFDESNLRWEKQNEEAKQRLAQLEKTVGGIGNNNGDMAEEFFFNAFRKDKIFMGEQYDRIHRGYFSSVDPYRNEFDIVFFNGKNIAIIEVKYKARQENVDIEHLVSRLEHFKKYAKEYKNHNLYLGVAAMSFESGLATKLHKRGIATIHPVGKKMVIYDKTVKAF